MVITNGILEERLKLFFSFSKGNLLAKSKLDLAVKRNIKTFKKSVYCLLLQKSRKYYILSSQSYEELEGSVFGFFAD